MSPKNLKFLPLALIAALSLLVAGLVLPAQGLARAAGTDPNLIQRVDQFIYKPAPGDLLLKPKPKHPKKPAKGAKN
jgi:hypothetical protein